MRLPSNATLSVRPGLDLAAVDGNLGLVRGAIWGSPYTVVRGDVARLGAILDAVRTEAVVERIVHALAPRFSESSVVETLEQLFAAGFVVPSAGAPAPRSPVVVVGDGGLALAIAAALGNDSAIDVHLVDALDEAVFETPTIDGAVPERGPRDAAFAPRLVVAALEDATYADVDTLGAAASRRGVPVLFVTYEAASVLVGPLFAPGTRGGFLESRRELLRATDPDASVVASSTLPALRTATVPVAEPAGRDVLARAVDAVAAEVERLLAPSNLPKYLASVALFSSAGGEVVHALPWPIATDGASVLGARDLRVDADVLQARAANLEERGARPLPTTIRTVGIVGGGTAGYLTALALRVKRPELDVTLIESSKIPVIGVGEATTALLVWFLHRMLGLDVVDFYARVRPTWKLGIRFEWGLPGDYHFNSPFQFGKLLESVVYDRDVNRSCLASRLMSDDTTPIIRTADGGHRSLLGEVPYAYHLDNQRFVRYLGEEAKRAGVRHLDAVVTEAVPSADRRSIDHLRTDDGRSLSYDLFVDCTGFRSLLMGKALGSPFVSYASSLYADTAVVADVPNRGLVRPHTVATTMNHGWCWNIAMEDEDHRGYVFSSAFASVSDATAEMRAKNPGMGDTRTIPFVSGRREDFWRGNCVAIGNSFAFVEPLQSTAIHMVLVEIQKLLSAFPREPGLFAAQSLATKEIVEVWDALRWFLAAHYRFNRRLDTPFWEHCRANADVSGIEPLIELYRERAPIGSTAHRFKELDLSTFGVYRYDLLFMGMGLDATYAKPLDDEATWRRAIAAVDRVAARALPHGAALEVLRNDPSMLRRHAREI